MVSAHVQAARERSSKKTSRATLRALGWNELFGWCFARYESHWSLISTDRAINLLSIVLAG